MKSRICLILFSFFSSNLVFASSDEYQSVRQVLQGEWQTQGSCNGRDSSLFPSGEIIQLYFDQKHPYMSVKIKNDDSLPSWLKEPRTRTFQLVTSPQESLNVLVTDSQKVYTSSSNTEPLGGASIEIFKVFTNQLYECNSRRVKGPCHVVDSIFLRIHTTGNHELIHMYSGLQRTQFKFGEKKLVESDINHYGAQIGFGCSRLKRVK